MAQDNNCTSSANSNASQGTVAEQLIKTGISPQSQLITIQLDETNYLLWRLRVETAIQGYRLEGYVLETISIPPKFITDTTNNLVSNEEYNKYYRQERLISAWLLSSISPNLLSRVVGCKTANEIRLTPIPEYFGPQHDVNEGVTVVTQEPSSTDTSQSSRDINDPSSHAPPSPSYHQRADILTKALSASNFCRLREDLRIQSCSPHRSPLSATKGTDLQAASSSSSKTATTKRSQLYNLKPKR